MAIDAKNQIWAFTSWGRPFRLLTPALDCTSPDSTPIQAECGWGTELLWLPLEMSIFGGHSVNLFNNSWKLLAIPRLPELSHTGRVIETEEEDTKVVKIAGMDGFLIALTNKGHVLKFGGLSNETFVHQAQWEYLPNFSETEKIRAHPAFPGGERREDGKPDALAPPVDVQITHFTIELTIHCSYITAHFNHFVAYTNEDSSIVLQRDTGTAAHVIPELQYKAIISVGLGDYYGVALSADGKSYSWGAFQMGALGLGQPEELPAGAPGGRPSTDRGQMPFMRWVSRIPRPRAPRGPFRVRDIEDDEDFLQLNIDNENVRR
ncbi:uncharacterized protein FOMMEDRAFT_143785 [Fomitiporia mediterranea MF3/22]|uniref:uncharacterized protein n=1 Tax=Fomitiporia mediterranea (strain MF3/22) TaxID=694068 RepID=UPI000440762D|nr:uncharacterized protein FOMMEDRAFT_143785 [Fomitiporia mediterranea MF3/22]EJD07334.1 hypothetical protein FOMMEDRAFT_143785 [Fomitiporia mediterranea MF3/22]